MRLSRLLPPEVGRVAPRPPFLVTLQPFRVFRDCRRSSTSVATFTQNFQSGFKTMRPFWGALVSRRRSSACQILQKGSEGHPPAAHRFSAFPISRFLDFSISRFPLVPVIYGLRWQSAQRRVTRHSSLFTHHSIPTQEHTGFRSPNTLSTRLTWGQNL